MISIKKKNPRKQKTKYICSSFIDRVIACISVNNALAKLGAGEPITFSDINYP